MKRTFRLTKWRVLLRFGFGIVLVILLAKVVHFAAIGKLLEDIKPKYLVVVLGVITLDRLMMAFK